MKTLIAHKRPFQQNLEEVHLENVTSWVSQCATEKCHVNSGLIEVQCWNSRSLCALKDSIVRQKGTNIDALHHSGINLAIDPLTRDFWYPLARLPHRFGEMVSRVFWKRMGEASPFTLQLTVRENNKHGQMELDFTRGAPPQDDGILAEWWNYISASWPCFP